MDKAMLEDTEPWFEMHQEEATRTIGWVLDLRRRMLPHHRSLELGAGRRQVTINQIGELLKFMGHDRVLRPLCGPLAELARSLEDGTPGSLAAYSKPPAVVAGAAPTGGRPPLDSTKRLRGAVTHLVQGLIAGKAFGATAAAEKVTKALNDAGIRMPNGGKFKPKRVTAWHENVIHHADHTDLEHKMCEALLLDLQRWRPEHAGWDSPQLERWLAETVRWMARNGYLNASRPKKLGSARSIPA